MKPLYSFFLLKQNFNSLIAGVAGFVIVILLTRHAIGISHDSIVYTSVARSLNNHKGLADYNGYPLVDFPCFYPIFLSAISFLTSFDPFVFGPYLNAFLFAVVVYLCGCITNSFENDSKIFEWILLALIVFSPSLLEVYSMLWSETLFICFSILFVIVLHQYFKTSQISILFLAAFVASVSTITRYAGISVIGTGGILLLLDKNLSIPKRFFRTILFGIIASALFAANLFYNSLITGTLTGAREKGITPLADNIKYYGTVMCDWLPFLKGNYSLAFAAGILIFLFFLVSFIKQYLKEPSFSLQQILSAFFIVYVSFIVASSTLSHYEKINNRLLAPAFIPMILSGCYKLKKILQKLISNKNTLKFAGAGLVILVLASELYQDKFLSDNISKASISGYASHTEIGEFLKHHQQEFDTAFTTYSNAPEAVYFFGGMKCDWLPNKDPKQVKEFIEDDDEYLIWFNSSQNPATFSLNDLLGMKKYKLLHKFKDGVIYKYDQDESE